VPGQEVTHAAQLEKAAQRAQRIGYGFRAEPARLANQRRVIYVGPVSVKK
jgi:hypothetical protein